MSMSAAERSPGGSGAPAVRAGPLASLPHVVHGFFGREGGVSQGLYASLNCGTGSHDAPENVSRNRALAARTLGVAPDYLISLYQVHSPRVVTVTEPWGPDDRPRADGMVCAVPGIALGILTADCGPVLLADTEAPVVGAAHAGWKGAVGGVLPATVEAMEALGADRARIVAALGPTIGQENYEVGPEFFDRFVAEDSENKRFFIPSRREDHWLFDLPAFIAHALGRCGVGRTEVLGRCTYAEEGTCFSYRQATHRREADYGRNLSAIALKSPSAP